MITYSELSKVTGGDTSESEKNVEIVDIIKELKYFEIASIQVYKGITFIIGQNNIDVELEEKILELQKEKNTINWSYKTYFKTFQDNFKGDKNRKCKFCYITTESSKKSIRHIRKIKLWKM